MKSDEGNSPCMDEISVERIKRPYSGKPLSEEELEELSSIQISETDTEIIFKIPGTAVCEGKPIIKILKIKKLLCVLRIA